MDRTTHWMLDDLPVGVWVATAPEGRGVYANRAFREILGMDVDSSSTIDDAPATYHIRDRAGNPFPVERLPFSVALATGERAIVDDIVLHRADGKKVPVRAFAHPVRDAEGRITHVIIAFLDIRQEMQARVDHETVLARLKLVVDHAPVAFFCIDSEGLITLSEGAGLEPLGVRPGELVGKNLFELYRGHPTIEGNIRRGLAGESLWYTTELGNIAYETWLTPLRDQEGAIVGAAGVSNDVSETRRLQAAAIQSDRVMAMGTLAASVAHEINNPLTYILASLDRLETEILGDVRETPRPEDGELWQLFHHVRHGFERIATITRELRTFTRPDDERREPISVETVIHAVLTLVRKEIEARAELIVSLADDAIVLANEARLVQVITNLMTNAIQSLPESRRDHRIEVVSRVEGEHVVIEVADSGPGVPVVDRDRIFEPFVTTKAIGVGTGLGLFVCRNIVRDLGGEIMVTDSAHGGALFRVVVPRSRGQRAADPPSSVPPEHAMIRGRVLIIDDDVVVASSLADCLAASGAETEVANDGKKALIRLLEGPSLDLVYCDLMMAGMTGMDIAEELAARRPALLERLVFMTGGAFTPRAAAFAEAHADQVVEKPFSIVTDASARLGSITTR